jgi:transcription initiation factor TFIIIB Brf1 subunit/transcription initiation factor TFIIB
LLATRINVRRRVQQPLQSTVPVTALPEPPKQCSGCITIIATSFCRLNHLALTLADVASLCHLNPHALGSHYRMLTSMLGLHPPPLAPADLLPRCFERLTRDAVAAGDLVAESAAAVRRDAGALLGWMQRSLETRRFPLGCVGAALVLAAESNAVGRVGGRCWPAAAHSCTAVSCAACCFPSIAPAC